MIKLLKNLKLRDWLLIALEVAIICLCVYLELLLPDYMFYLMISKYVVDGLNQYMKGDNSPSISRNDIENWLYPIPPIDEQRRICYILKTTFATIEKLEESLI